MKKLFILSLLYALVASAANGNAQTLNTTISAVRNREAFGFAVMGNILLNGDSVPDIVIGAIAGQQSPNEGKVYVFSGSNAQLVRTLSADSSVDNVSFNHFGYGLANTGDLNSDAVPDILVGAPGIFNSEDQGFIRFFSGSNGDTLGVVRAGDIETLFGTSVSALGDVTGDGIPDALATEPEFDPDPFGELEAYVVSGASSHTVWDLPNSPASSQGNAVVTGISDIDEDSYDDILLATSAVGGTGAFQLFSGDSRTLIASVCFHSGTYPLCGGSGGAASSAIRLNDVNQDGVGDFAIGVPSGNTGTGLVKIYSGANRSVIRTLSNQSLGDYFGYSLANMGDLDGDGVDDIAVGAVAHGDTNPSNGYVRAFSAKTGNILYTINGTNTVGQFAISIANAGDLNADGVNDIIIGESSYNPGSEPGTGRVHLYNSPSCLAQSRLNTVVLPSDDGYQLLTHHMDGCAD